MILTERLVAYKHDKNSKENKMPLRPRQAKAQRAWDAGHFNYPKGQLSGMGATPESKTASLTTSTVRKVPKRTFAIHVSRSDFVGWLFMLDQPAFRPLVRFVRRKILAV